MRHWAGRCPLTGITDAALLRASHIKPWAACDSDEERLDPYNGLLLSSLWDAAFDAGLVRFGDDGEIGYAEALRREGRLQLERSVTGRLRLDRLHLPYLAWRRQ